MYDTVNVAYIYEQKAGVRFCCVSQHARVRARVNSTTKADGKSVLSLSSRSLVSSMPRLLKSSSSLEGHAAVWGGSQAIRKVCDAIGRTPAPR